MLATYWLHGTFRCSQPRKKPLACCAKRLYALGDQKQQDIARALGVSASTVSGWLSRTIKEEKERKKEKAHAMWMACHTQEEIAEAVDVAGGTVATWETEFLKTSDDEELRNWHSFEPPIYNVWKQQNKSNTVGHFGNSEPRWVENLLWLYTQPGSVVVDPFAGSASTIDVCRKRGLYLVETPDRQIGVTRQPEGREPFRRFHTRERLLAFLETQPREKAWRA